MQWCQVVHSKASCALCACRGCDGCVGVTLPPLPARPPMGHPPPSLPPPPTSCEPFSPYDTSVEACKDGVCEASRAVEDCNFCRCKACAICGAPQEQPAALDADAVDNLPDGGIADAATPAALPTGRRSSPPPPPPPATRPPPRAAAASAPPPDPPEGPALPPAPPSASCVAGRSIVPNREWCASITDEAACDSYYVSSAVLPRGTPCGWNGNRCVIFPCVAPPPSPPRRAPPPPRASPPPPPEEADEEEDGNDDDDQDSYNTIESSDAAVRSGRLPPLGVGSVERPSVLYTGLGASAVRPQGAAVPPTAATASADAAESQSKIEKVGRLLGLPAWAVLGGMLLLSLLACGLLGAFCSGALTTHRHQKIAPDDEFDDDSGGFDDDDDDDDDSTVVDDPREPPAEEEYAFAARGGHKAASRRSRRQAAPEGDRERDAPTKPPPQSVDDLIATSQSGLASAIDDAAAKAKASAKAELEAALLRLNDME